MKLPSILVLCLLEMLPSAVFSHEPLATQVLEKNPLRTWLLGKVEQAATHRAAAALNKPEVIHACQQALRHECQIIE